MLTPEITLLREDETHRFFEVVGRNQDGIVGYRGGLKGRKDGSNRENAERMLVALLRDLHVDVPADPLSLLEQAIAKGR